MTLRLNVGLLLTICLAATLPAEESDWTGWLGPNRDGWVADFQPPDHWPQTLTKQWQVDVGTGYGTPLVVGDRLFQHARQEEDEVVWCVSLSSGKVVWRKSYAVPFKMGGGGERHGKGPKSNPRIDIPEPGKPGSGEALVETKSVGICGTDVSSYLGKFPFFDYPRIPGHELGVEVVAVGEGVEAVANR